MRYRVIPAIALTTALLSMPALAATPEDPQWPYQVECAKWTKVPVPAQDIGTAPQQCDAQALYYGKDGKGAGRDGNAARHCAYRERGSGTAIQEQGAVFGGSGLLMMLYANGEGVARNIPLAKRFACEYGGAPAEVEGRLQHLDAIASGKDGKPMDICDDVTSGMMMGFCTGREGDSARAQRETRWTSLQSTWSPSQRNALAELRKSAKAYFDSVSTAETDMSGTARGAMAETAYENLDKTLFTDIEGFEHGKRPATRAQDFAAADRSLNATYKKVLARLGVASSSSDGSQYGTVSANGVRATQRLWLNYREAWVRFATTRYPAVAADTWRAWLSRERSGALLELISD
ncbi:lysozyme inhibitor LprI family protein [Solilutibacter silvestris]|uniref:Lysozyme inhibitor LprI-like N-terminal domain-containing protein n=1 Tax=Solilutibacter silvestris TaxID=1645665 RepID=A0A2K1PY00_9GAMM|nr:lysozyme inhibitor LprI family protein [Lysobacter silvestris]PNS07665.1 hypothetical protein Lysil_1841 [Lysobacter silvestris]